MWWGKCTANVLAVCIKIEEKVEICVLRYWVAVNLVEIIKEADGQIVLVLVEGRSGLRHQT